MKFYNDMLYLCLCALNNTIPKLEYVENIDIDALYKECVRHKVATVAGYALQNVIELPKNWNEAKGKAVRNSLLFDAERDKIISFMNENGIKHMLLKGALIKDMYPKIGMREMSDNDIYYDITFRDKLNDFMIGLGYQCLEKTDDQDAYEKKPIYYIELHHALFLKSKYKKLHNYYADLEKRLIRDSDDTFGCHFSNEDLYIYLIAHEYKHFSRCGTGIRSLLDCLVFLNKYENSLDWKYIIKELNIIGISDFEKEQRDLCKKLNISMLNGDFSKSEVEFLEYMISCGVYGERSIGVQNKITGTDNVGHKVKTQHKLGYIWSRIFPPVLFYKDRYPFFYKHKVLIPICVVYRLYSALFKRSEYVKTEIEILKK